MILGLFGGFSGIAAQSAAEGNCPDTQFTEWGMNGVVTPGDSNNVRAEPSTSAEVVGRLDSSMPFNVVYESATCADGYLWIEIINSTMAGWTVERPADGSAPFVVPFTPEPRPTGSSASDGSIVVEEDGITFTVPAGLNVAEVTVLREIGLFGDVMGAQPSSLLFTLVDEAGDAIGTIQIFRYATGSDSFEMGQDETLEMMLDEQPPLLLFSAKERMPQAPIAGAAALFGGAGAYVPFTTGTGVRYITLFAQDSVMFTPDLPFELLFRGLSDDRAFFIAAQDFPVLIPEGAIPLDTGDIIYTDRYVPYLREFEANLAAAPASAFTPDLALFDALFGSLTITDNEALSALIP
jgi:hypothetical protein